MINKHFILFLVITILLYAIPTIAQDTPACEADALTDTVNGLIGKLGEVREETDPKKLSDALQYISNQAIELRATCDGLVFSGTNQKVIAPVEFPQGIYKAVVKTDGYVAVTVTPTSGECGQGVGNRMMPNVFLLTKGQASGEGSEATFTSNSCIAVVEVSAVTEAWSLSFQRLTTD